MTNAKTRTGNSGNRPWVNLADGIFGAWPVVLAAAAGVLWLGDCLETAVQKEKRINHALAPWIRRVEALEKKHESHETNGPLIEHRLRALEKAMEARE